MIAAGGVVLASLLSGAAKLPAVTLQPPSVAVSAAQVAWSVASQPAAPAQTDLFGVSCVTAADCWAVGYSGNSIGVIEQGTGSSWSLGSPDPTGGDYVKLLGVTCVTASDCWAVGASDPTAQPVIEHYTGTGTEWTIMSNPSASGSLSAVACASAGDCWAVGTVVEHYNGTAWTVDSSAPGGAPSPA